MLTKNQQKQLSKALQAVAQNPTAVRRLSRELDRDGEEVINLAVATGLKNIFCYSTPPSDDIAAETRRKEVLSELSKKSGHGPAAVPAKAVSEAVKKGPETGTVAFWRSVFLREKSIARENLSEFVDILSSTVPNKLLVRSDLDTLVEANGLGAVEPDTIDSVLRQNGFTIVPAIPRETYRALAGRSAANLVELFNPRGSHAEGTPLPFTLFPVATADGHVVSQASLEEALVYYDQRGSKSERDKDAVSAARSLTRRSEHTASSLILAYYLTFISEQRAKRVLDPTIAQRLLSAGLVKDDVQRLLASSRASSDSNVSSRFSNSGADSPSRGEPSGHRTNIDSDVNNFQTVWDKFSAGHVYRANLELSSLLSSGVEVQTKIWLERIKKVQQGANRASRLLREGRNALAGDKVDRAAEIADHLRVIDPNWRGLSELDKEISRRKWAGGSGAGPSLGKRAKKALDELDFQLAKRCADNAIKQESSDRDAQEVLDVLNAMAGDQLWCFRSGRRWDWLNPFLNPVDVKPGVSLLRGASFGVLCFFVLVFIQTGSVAPSLASYLSSHPEMLFSDVFVGVVVAAFSHLLSRFQAQKTKEILDAWYRLLSAANSGVIDGCRIVVVADKGSALEMFPLTGHYVDIAADRDLEPGDILLLSGPDVLNRFAVSDVIRVQSTAQDLGKKFSVYDTVSSIANS